ncbi:hypothetical protein D3C73_1571970 [compost metagenome]
MCDAAGKAAERIGIVLGEMVVVHFHHLPVPFDRPGMAVAGVEVVGGELVAGALILAIEPETIERIADEVAVPVRT